MKASLAALPPLQGRPVSVEFVRKLTSCNRRLESGTGRGTEVHAASFLRGRRVVLDSALLKRPPELRRILIHELFHFVWVRAGNRWRFEYERLVRQEHVAGARGELGWSAEWRKDALRAHDRAARTRRWREYVCESFCDTAAWLYSPGMRHPEFTLAARYRSRRREWFHKFLALRPEVSF